jgi:uncharacterized protein (UPF0276 family)
LRVAAALPVRAGVGLKSEHVDAILIERPDVGFFEIHAENYMGDGGPPHRRLEAIRGLYPLSLHGVGLSIGSPRPLDDAHLGRLAALARRYEPGLFSEHLAWSSHDTGFLNDLLPLPYTEETLAGVCAHVDETQEAVGRRMLLENPSTYLLFAESTIPETEFYLDAFPLQHVGEIHLAGYAEAKDEAGHRLLIDAHDSPVRPNVWALYEAVISRIGPTPTLVEWDNDVPAWPVLHAEARRADRHMASARARALRHAG